jgi:hypothetical protein
MNTDDLALLLRDDVRVEWIDPQDEIKSLNGLVDSLVTQLTEALNRIEELEQANAGLTSKLLQVSELLVEQEFSRREAA